VMGMPYAATFSANSCTVGWGTTAQDNSTCSLAPEGSYSPGGLIVSTPIQPCTTGTTNTGAGNTVPASCDRCVAGKPCYHIPPISELGTMPLGVLLQILYSCAGLQCAYYTPPICCLTFLACLSQHKFGVISRVHSYV
jgi:hypothetical protein